MRVFCSRLGLPDLEVPVPFLDVLVQFLFGLEGASRDAVSEAWESQVFKISIEFLAVAAVLSDDVGPDFV